MSTGLERLQAGRHLTWRTILGLLLVPLTAAGILLWGLWNPTDRLETVTAAVVNLDESVEIDGQIVPMGRVLAAELIGSADDDDTTNFTWVLTDEDDAASGLDDGRYATVITIPKNFSAAATSMSRGADEAERATIDIATSERGRLLDSALSSIVTQTATAVLNEQLGTQFVGQVFVGMNQIGTGIGEAADGAEQLAEGSGALADGVSQLGTGIGELSTGASTLASGAGELSNGAAELATGASGLAGGARQAADGGSQLADGVAQYTGAVNQVVSAIVENSAGAVEPLQQMRNVIATVPAEAWPADADMSQEQLLGTLDALIAEFSAASSGSGDSQLVQLQQAGEQLAAGTRASADGQAQLATGLEQYASGMGEYAAGVAEFSTGLGAYATGAAEAATGATQLADGAQQAADGTTSLAEGLREAADEIPSYTDDEAERLAQTAVQPVESEGANDELFNASGVPLFAGIALWAGAFASFLVLAPLWRRTSEAARGVGYVTLRSSLPALLIGAAQGALAGVILPLLLGYDFGQGAGFFALAVVAGASFSLVNQGLSALLGGFGRFLSFAMLVVAFAIGVISTAPPLLQAIGDGSPIGALFGGFQAVAMGASGLGTAIFALVVWGLGGLVLTALAVARRRKRLAV